MSVNALDSTRLGEGVHIGVLDTLGDPSEHYNNPIDIASVHDDYVETDSNDPFGHGTDVLDIIWRSAIEATYSTFQVIGVSEDENGERFASGKPSDMIRGIMDAIESGVDILNLSIGTARDCYGACSLCREVRQAATHDGVTIVAATGNRDSTGQRNGVCCPAVSESTIGVGGYMPFCKRQIDENGNSSQWWINPEEDDMWGPYCGNRGCHTDGECAENRREVLWGGNVSFHNAAPDVLAPVVYIRTMVNGDWYEQQGTSFAAPIVTGLLSAIKSDLAVRDINPSPKQMCAAVKYAGTEIDEGGYVKLDAKGTKSELLSLS